MNAMRYTFPLVLAAIILASCLAGCEYGEGTSGNGLLQGGGTGDDGDSGGRPSRTPAPSNAPPPPLARDTGDDDDDRQPPREPEDSTDEDGNRTVTFRDGTEVTVSPVALQVGEVEFGTKDNPQTLTGPRVVTNLPPTRGTLFVLLSIEYWARAEDVRPFKVKNTTLTIRQNAERSHVYLPEPWPGATIKVSIQPMERIQELERPFATYERHIVRENHEFVPYEPIEGSSQLIFQPE